MADFERGENVRCWPGVRPGRSYVGRAVTGRVVDFCGTPALWIAKPVTEGGGHDHIALTHLAAKPAMSAAHDAAARVAPCSLPPPPPPHERPET